MGKVEHKISEEAAEHLKSELAKVTDSERWMVVAWRIKDGKIELAHRTTYKFPRDDYLVAIGQLTASCIDDKAESKVLPDDPLPAAFPEVFTGPVDDSIVQDDGSVVASIDVEPPMENDCVGQPVDGPKLFVGGAEEPIEVKPAVGQDIPNLQIHTVSNDPPEQEEETYQECKEDPMAGRGFLPEESECDCEEEQCEG